MDTDDIFSIVKYYHLSKNPKLKKKSLKGRLMRKPNKMVHLHYDVFLGGACNPTKWREDHAIPFLEREGIHYYNPQVDNWTPDLIRKEQKAKCASRVLLFVLDPTQTRGIASLIELAFLIAQKRTLVVVKPTFNHLKHLRVNGEKLSRNEHSSLIEGFRLLDEMLGKNENVFSNLDDALIRIKRIIEDDKLGKSANVSLHSKKIASSQLKRNSLESTDPRRSAIEICPLCHKKGVLWSDVISTYDLSERLIPCCDSPVAVLDCSSPLSRKKIVDLYIGGDVGFSHNEGIISNLRNNNHSFIRPIRSSPTNFEQRNLLQKHCAILFYPFTISSFSLPAQLEAAYAIGKGRRVVIWMETFPFVHRPRPKHRCISEGNEEEDHALQSDVRKLASKDSGNGSFDSIAELDASAVATELPPPPPPPVCVAQDRRTSETHSMSASSIQDHNRGRSYLMSVASQMNCQVVNFSLNASQRTTNSFSINEVLAPISL